MEWRKACKCKELNFDLQMQIGEQGCVTSIDFVAIMKLAEFHVPI